MKTTTLAVAAILLLTPAGLLAQKVHYDMDEQADLTKYKTFAYRECAPLHNPLMDQRVRNGIKYHLSLLGYEETEANPDMFVTYHGITQAQHQLDTTSFGYGMGGGWRWGGGMGSSTTQVRTYYKGTLVIDMYDAKTNHMIYRGTGTDSISDKPQKNEKKINKVLDKLFNPEKWPPKR